MVKDLNLQSGGEGSSPHTCNLGLLKLFAYITYLIWINTQYTRAKMAVQSPF
jgi:hypothetical protein